MLISRGFSVSRGVDAVWKWCCPGVIRLIYGWWKKSCTSWYVVYPIIHMVFLKFFTSQVASRISSINSGRCVLDVPWFGNRHFLEEILADEPGNNDPGSVVEIWCDLWIHLFAVTKINGLQWEKSWECRWFPSWICLQENPGNSII